MQTSISDNPAVAVAGALADEGPRRIGSFNVSTQSGAPAGLDAGLGAFRREGTDLITEARSALGAGAVTGLTFMGVTMFDTTKAPLSFPTTYDYEDGETVPVVESGIVWVYSETAVKPADPVHVRVVAAGAEVAGRFRNAADSTDCIDVSKYARWDSVTTAAGLARLRLNIP